MNTIALAPPKQRRFLDLLPDVAACMQAIFDFYGPTHLPDTLDHWLLLALGGGAESPYLNGSERAALLCFARDLQALSLALYRIHIAPPAPEADHARVAFFCRAYPLRHSRAELWDLLDAVVSCPEGIVRGNIVWDFEALLCLAEAAYSCSPAPAAQPFTPETCTP